jgi:hypothetical protein
MTKDQIQKYLQSLNDELSNLEVKGEVCLYGGAVMCLAYDARPSTKDVLMKIQTADEVLSILEKYYPREQVKPATKYFIDELFET